MFEQERDLWRNGESITMKASSTWINILYEGKDISRDIAPYLLTFTFTDNAGGKADDLSLTMQDKSGTWLRDWLPSKGDIITAAIVQEKLDRTQLLPCGSFTVDQIDYSESPATFSIKGVSASVKKSIAQQKRSQSWENITLSQIITDIAAKNQLALFIDADAGQTISRIDQTEQSDLDFLQNLCADYGLTVKIQNDRIVVYDLAKYEEKDAVKVITRGDKDILSVRFSSKTAKVYKSAKVKYHDPVQDEDYEAEELDDDVEGSERELEIYERVESQSDAQRVAQQRLASANRQEVTGSISLVGDIGLAAGLTVTLSGYGMFSGKHFINKATHSVGNSGYTVSLELGLPSEEKKKGKARKTSRKSKTVHQELFYEGEHYY